MGSLAGLIVKYALCPKESFGSLTLVKMLSAKGSAVIRTPEVLVVGRRSLRCRTLSRTLRLVGRVRDEALDDPERCSKNEIDGADNEHEVN